MLVTGVCGGDFVMREDGFEKVVEEGKEDGVEGGGVCGLGFRG